MSKLTKKNETDKKKERARELAKIGLTTREIGKIVGKSHAWVAVAIKEKAVDNSVLV
jgi:transposase-like protein